MWDVLLDALLDSVKILPFLLVIYILIEFLETETASMVKARKLLCGKVAPIVGAGIGIVPQCGFSVVATNLYNKGYIALGTLFAVYISTSDEAIPIMLSQPDSFDKLWKLLLVKFIFAIIVGYVINLVTRNKRLNVVALDVNADGEVETDEHDTGCCHHDIDNKGGKWTKYLLHPLIHSLKIFCYILAVNVVFGIVLHFVGIDKLSAFMLSTKEFQPFLVGLVGLIPNCASSVLIAQLFVNGMINFGSAVAGLSVNAGIAFTVLFTNKHTKSNILIIVTLYVVSTLLGFALSFIPFFN